MGNETLDHKYSGSSDSSSEPDQEQLEGLISSLKYRTQRRRCQIPWLPVVLAVSNILLVVALIKVAIDRPNRKSIEKTSIVPELEKLEIFEYQPLYSDPPTPESEKAWKNMLPVGKGFVTIPGEITKSIPDQPKLNQSLPEQHAILAVFHQIHCLYAIREGYFALMEGDTTKVPPGHMGHCWDYLRQSVMCNSDTTLEWVAPPPGDKMGSTGWGYQHTCKDFGAIYTWAEENRWMTSTGIH